jgi:hypothetical protein
MGCALWVMGYGLYGLWAMSYGLSDIKYYASGME